MLTLGLSSWILIGLIVGLVSYHFLPGTPRLHWAAALAVGLAGAVLGGLLATWLGFGGLSGFDLRGFTTATLGAVVLLLGAQILGLARE